MLLERCDTSTSRTFSSRPQHLDASSVRGDSCATRDPTKSPERHPKRHRRRRVPRRVRTHVNERIRAVDARRLRLGHRGVSLVVPRELRDDGVELSHFRGRHRDAKRSGVERHLRLGVSRHGRERLEDRRVRAERGDERRGVSERRRAPRRSRIPRSRRDGGGYVGDGNFERVEELGRLRRRAEFDGGAAPESNPTEVHEHGRWVGFGVGRRRGDARRVDVDGDVHDGSIGERGEQPLSRGGGLSARPLRHRSSEQLLLFRQLRRFVSCQHRHQTIDRRPERGDVRGRHRDGDDDARRIPTRGFCRETKSKRVRRKVARDGIPATRTARVRIFRRRCRGREPLLVRDIFVFVVFVAAARVPVRDVAPQRLGGLVGGDGPSRGFRDVRRASRARRANEPRAVDVHIDRRERRAVIRSFPGVRSRAREESRDARAQHRRRSFFVVVVELERRRVDPNSGLHLKRVVRNLERLRRRGRVSFHVEHAPELRPVLLGHLRVGVEIRIVRRVAGGVVVVRRRRSRSRKPSPEPSAPRARDLARVVLRAGGRGGFSGAFASRPSVRERAKQHADARRHIPLDIVEDGHLPDGDGRGPPFPRRALLSFRSRVRRDVRGVRLHVPSPRAHRVHQSIDPRGDGPLAPRAKRRRGDGEAPPLASARARARALRRENRRRRSKMRVRRAPRVAFQAFRGDERRAKMARGETRGDSVDSEMDALRGRVRVERLAFPLSLVRRERAHGLQEIPSPRRLFHRG